jgi:hypothetical protein
MTLSIDLDKENIRILLDAVRYLRQEEEEVVRIMRLKEKEGEHVLIEIMLEIEAADQKRKSVLNFWA